MLMNVSLAWTLFFMIVSAYVVSVTILAIVCVLCAREKEQNRIEFEREMFYAKNKDAK